MKNALITIIAALLLIGGVQFADAAPPKGTNATIQKGQPTTSWMRTPCVFEDSVNCYWDAGSRGNKKGNSFYVRKFDGILCVFYVNRTRANRWDFCRSDEYGGRAVVVDDRDGAVE